MLDVLGFFSMVGSVFVSTSVSMISSICIWAAWSINGSDPHRDGICLSMIIRILSKCLHLLARSWQSQYEHWSEMLYHSVVMFNTLNQYGASFTICIGLVWVTYLSNILSVSLSLDLWSLQLARGAYQPLSHISCCCMDHSMCWDNYSLRMGWAGDLGQLRAELDADRLRAKCRLDRIWLEATFVNSPYCV